MRRILICVAAVLSLAAPARPADPETLNNPALEIYFAQVCAFEMYVATTDAAYADSFAALFDAYRYVVSPGALAEETAAARDACLDAASLFLSSGYVDQSAFFEAFVAGDGWAGDAGGSNPWAWYGAWAGYYAYLDLPEATQGE